MYDNRTSRIKSSRYVSNAFNISVLDAFSSQFILWTNLVISENNNNQTAFVLLRYVNLIHVIPSLLMKLFQNWISLWRFCQQLFQSPFLLQKVEIIDVPYYNIGNKTKKYPREGILLADTLLKQWRLLCRILRLLDTKSIPTKRMMIGTPSCLILFPVNCELFTEN